MKLGMNNEQHATVGRSNLVLTPVSLLIIIGLFNDAFSTLLAL